MNRVVPAVVPAVVGALLVGGAVLGLTNCGGGEPSAPPPVPVAPKPPPAPAKVTPLPEVTPRPMEREAKLPQPIALSPKLKEARATLEQVVRRHALEPGNAWAIGHAMLALGPEVQLTNGTKAVDYLFAEYAEWVQVDEERAVWFPRRRGAVRIEPHTDLLLKGITEGGISPARDIAVDKQLTVPAKLYQHSLYRAWFTPSATGFDSFDDTPWALQGLAAWAPDDLAWTAKGGHAMTMDDFTHHAVEHIATQSASLHQAAAKGVMPKKDGQGIVGYSCGGQHFVQGAAFARARGFGVDNDTAKLCAKRDLMRWRIDHELSSIDPLLQEHARDVNVSTVLLNQRLKFLGHYLETASKFGAYELCPWTDADAAALQRAADELVTTVTVIDSLGLWDDLEGKVRKNRALDPYRPTSGGAQQVFLDYLGDAAHAVRGIDLATGVGVVRY